LLRLLRRLLLWLLLRLRLRSLRVAVNAMLLLVQL
jgi:hypothetical protein